MAQQSNNQSGGGCFTVFAVLFFVFFLIGVFVEETDLPRDYVEPLSSQDEIAAFAKAKLDALQAKSFAEGIEFCGMIYENGEGELSSSEVFRGEESHCDFEFEWGGNLNPVASFHTHGDHDREFDNEAPSLIDLEEDIANQVDGYIATPGGRFWQIDWREREAVMLCGEQCVKRDPKYRPCRGYLPKKSYDIEGLKDREEVDPDVC